MHVATHSDDWGIGGAIRHMSSAYALDQRGQHFCELNPDSFGRSYAVRVLLPSPKHGYVTHYSKVTSNVSALRAEQLAGIVPDESTCPMAYLSTGDSDSARPKIVIDDVFPPALPWKVVFQDARVCCWHHHLNIQSLSFWMINQSVIAVHWFNWRAQCIVNWVRAVWNVTGVSGNYYQVILKIATKP